MEIINKEYANTAKLFRRACELAKTEPTSRQAAKFQTRRGKAFKFYNDAKKELLEESKNADKEKQDRFDKQVSNAVDSGMDVGALKPVTEGAIDAGNK